MIPLFDAPPAPRGLLFLAMFSKREREEITSSPQLKAAVRAGSPAEWLEIVRQHRQDGKGASGPDIAVDGEAMRRQALDDLLAAATALAELTDNRRGQLFAVTCRIAKYVAHGVLSEAETVAALTEAAAANRSLARYGQRWADSTIKRALFAGRNDDLPPLARCFRSQGARS